MFFYSMIFPVTRNTSWPALGAKGEQLLFNNLRFSYVNAGIEFTFVSL